MKYYSINRKAPEVSLQEAVLRGLAPDNGLYMPESFPILPNDFFEGIDRMTFSEMACYVARALFEDVSPQVMDDIVRDTLSFDVPAVRITDRIYALELFHGPTLAFKDVGARFMARLLHYFSNHDDHRRLNVLVATSGDTGSAVANGFLRVPGVHVYVLYPKNKVSKLQEQQFATLGHNITALEIDGTFDDCQALVKKVFLDDTLQQKLRLTSANSINLARLLPQSFYYFYAYAQLKRLGIAQKVVVSVPSGNFGNLTAGLIAWHMGLPVHRFIAANNRNDVFLNFLQTGEYHPRPSVATIANAMDVGAPSNFARLFELFKGDLHTIRQHISGEAFNDVKIESIIRDVYRGQSYLLDPHGACACGAVAHQLQPSETGIFLETAHPAKFCETVGRIIGRQPNLPDRLQNFLVRKKCAISLDKDFNQLKAFLMAEDQTNE